VCEGKAHAMPKCRDTYARRERGLSRAHNYSVGAC